MLRGIAIILVMVGHGVGLLVDTDIIPSDVGGFIYDAIYTFHMPLFFMISGYLYRNNNEKAFNIIIKNVITFYIPYLFLNYLYWFERAIASGVFGIQLMREEYPGGIELLWRGDWLTWFLLSLMLVKIVFNLLDTYVSDISAFVMFSLFFWLYDIFSCAVLYYLQWGVFFCLGYIMNRYSVETKRKSILYIGCINLLLFGIERYALCGLDEIVKIFTGVSVFGMYMCIKKIPHIKLLALCGKNSMVIYIIHGLSQYVCYYVITEILHIRVSFILLSFMIVLQLLLAFLVVKLFTEVKYLHWLQIIFYPYKYIVEKKRQASAADVNGR
ncbi:MAG: acyltransferase family protein [Blautia sp.]|nr:acyltransferase family protein [Blautia sp.]MCM1201834.1 acyltransferase family protein [Bacteroides fragilis]